MGAALSALRRPWNPWTYSLAGIPADRWWRLLKENQFAVDPLFYDRFVFHTLFSLVNTMAGKREERVYGAAIDDTRVTDAPIFIVGPHRSGTTHLHNLLGCDELQFAYPNTYQAVFPFSFLGSERTLGRIVALLLLKRRPMDNMALDPRYPQEDEFALSLLSLCSPYLAFAFPRHYDRYLAYLTFHAASASEIGRWQAALVWFVKKLTFKYQRRLVLKSPFHTARVRLILEVLPSACFIHIHRHPYAIFQSLRHMLQVFPWYLCLQDPGGAFTDDRIIEQYSQVYDSFFRDRAAIPGDQLYDLEFEALERDPIGEIRSIYEKFSLPGFDLAQPKLQRYLRSVAGYEKNRYPELPPPLKRRLAHEWQQSFETLRYPV
jgi:omega-hydroxy-beta-dihydromenaquinone-9 sulfotransferase